MYHILQFKKSLAAVIFITGLATGSLLLLLTQLPNITSVHLVGSICSCIQIGCACTMLYMIVTLYSIWIEDFYLLISNGIFMTIDGLVFLLFFIYPSEPTNLFLVFKNVQTAAILETEM
ncbi:death-associated protein 1 [Trichinella spiralis]|uniref:death-associated protein 1 n=1 Tax=Trichinella spiralis TaxID=6334 RepID=UPI0001EFD125|nr:death-associated protein 1 [Trichinella spiralis]